jgi:hypothetical protein
MGSRGPVTEREAIYELRIERVRTKVNALRVRELVQLVDIRT